MKIICQIGVIFAVCWFSQLIEAALPVPFPASVIGMLLLLALLATGLLKIEHIREKADFLLANMAFFFLPAGVSVINYFDVLGRSAVALVLVCLLSTVITFGATALSIRFTLRLLERRKSRVWAACFPLFWHRFEYPGLLGWGAHPEKDRPGGL